MKRPANEHPAMPFTVLPWQRQAQGQRHTSSAASAIRMVGSHRPVEVHVGLTVKLVVHGEVQARDGRPRLRHSALGYLLTAVKFHFFG